MLPLALLAFAPAAPVPAVVAEREGGGLSRVLVAGIRAEVARAIRTHGGRATRLGELVPRLAERAADKAAAGEAEAAAHWTAQSRAFAAEQADLLARVAALRRLRDRVGGR